MKARSWLWLLGLLAALGGCDKRPGLQIGDAMPAVTLMDFRGKSVALPGDFKGKVILVRFWSLDCGFCDKAMLQTLERFYRKYQDQGFVPIAINEGPIAAGDERIRQFEGLTYPMLTEDYGVAARQFGVIGLPVTFVFDEEGVLREKLTGEARIEEYEKLFTTVLYKGGFYDSAY
jgi:cytochrome c biogenesis protein CcmG/thiol:disulfide interchange protein DsbE